MCIMLKKLLGNILLNHLTFQIAFYISDYLMFALQNLIQVYVRELQ